MVALGLKVSLLFAYSLYVDPEYVASTANNHKKRAAMLLFCLVFARLVQVVLLLELFYTTTASHILLLTCVERMARGTNVGSDFGFVGHCCERVSACASNFTFHVVRMDSFLHASHLSLFRPSPKFLKLKFHAIRAQLVCHSNIEIATVFPLFPWVFL